MFMTIHFFKKNLSFKLILFTQIDVKNETSQFKIALLSDANFPVHLTAQLWTKYSSLQLMANCILQKYKCKVCPTLYQTDLRISNHRGLKFPLSLMNLNRRASSVELNCKFSEPIFSPPATFKAKSKLFSSQGCSNDKN